MSDIMENIVLLQPTAKDPPVLFCHFPMFSL